jgi:hypothetical protein
MKQDLRARWWCTWSAHDERAPVSLAAVWQMAAASENCLVLLAIRDATTDCAETDNDVAGQRALGGTFKTPPMLPPVMKHRIGHRRSRLRDEDAQRPKLCRDKRSLRENVAATAFARVLVLEV